MCLNCDYFTRIRKIKDLAVNIYDTTQDIPTIERVLRILRDCEEAKHIGDEQWAAYGDIAQEHAWTLSHGLRMGN